MTLLKELAATVLQRAWRERRRQIAAHRIQTWWRTRLPPIASTMTYYLLNDPTDKNQTLYIHVLKTECRLVGIKVMVEIVPTLWGSVRSAFRSMLRRDTTNGDGPDVIAIGSHGCDCFTHAGIVVEQKSNGTSVVHSVCNLLGRIVDDSGPFLRPIFLDSCGSFKYPLNQKDYPLILGGHEDAPLLEDAISSVVEFGLLATIVLE